MEQNIHMLYNLIADQKGKRIREEERKERMKIKIREVTGNLNNLTEVRKGAKK